MPCQGGGLCGGSTSCWPGGGSGCGWYCWSGGMPGGGAGTGCGAAGTGAITAGDTGAMLPAPLRACSARATTDSGGAEAEGTIARSTTRSSRISHGRMFSVTKSNGKIWYQGSGKGWRTVSVS